MNKGTRWNKGKWRQVNIPIPWSICRIMASHPTASKKGWNRRRTRELVAAGVRTAGATLLKRSGPFLFKKQRVIFLAISVFDVFVGSFFEFDESLTFR